MLNADYKPSTSHLPTPAELLTRTTRQPESEGSVASMYVCSLREKVHTRGRVKVSWDVDSTTAGDWIGLWLADDELEQFTAPIK